MNLQETDPEFMERFEHFALHEVVSEENQSLEEQTRSIVILAALIGCQGTDAYREMLPQALRLGVTPVMVKEIVYQAADYLDREGIAVRGGLHCAPGAHRFLGTLERGAVRASVGHETTFEDVEALLRAVKKMLRET